MSEIADIVQIVRIEFEGIQLAMKITGASLDTMKKAVKFLHTMLSYEKSLGKTTLKKMLMRGGDLHVFMFDKEQEKEVRKLCKKYGVLYTEIPNKDKDSKRMEILFHSEATPRMNMVLQKMKNPSSAQIKSMDSFLKETDDKRLAGIDEFLQEQKKGNTDMNIDASLSELIDKVGKYAIERTSVSVDDVKRDFDLETEESKKILSKLSQIGVIEEPDNLGHSRVIMNKEAYDERMRRFQDLARRMKQIEVAKNTNLRDITISKKLVETENEHAYKTRIPGTFGTNVRFLWLRKEDVMEIHNGKTILTYLDMSKDYKLYTKDNRVAGTMRGSRIYENHYDAVDRAVRERYEKQFRNMHDIVKTISPEKVKSR